MAVLRVIWQRSCAISYSLCPSVVQEVHRQFHMNGISALSGGGGTFLSVANARSILFSKANLGMREWQSNKATKVTFCVRATEWTGDQSPYETLGVASDVDEDGIKSAYRQMAKQFHPDVYSDSTGGLNEGETPEARFIRIQAAYELLMDKEQRRQYDLDHHVNPMKASKVWMDWVMKKKKAFEQRGDMAASVWAEQQQREMSLRARRLAKHKMDPEEERRILAKEKLAAVKNFETTINRHTLALKKRELIRRKDAEEAKKKLVQQLLAAEGLELDDDRY